MEHDSQRRSKQTKMKQFQTASGYNFEASLTNSNDSSVAASWLKVPLTEFDCLNRLSSDASLMTSDGSIEDSIPAKNFQDFSSSFVSQSNPGDGESKFLLELALDHFFNVFNSEI
ncbi:uncharacterized protein PRCAT00005047001 [Priceomyces carsonii]|uniref:uncharacterized protein n=1 Tax=Priceomyces carsonii TaxID=28549 RepID=UPI002ED77C0C|nr:unnamed protein product [Priceomyces carsonii]